jgi:hypothetical protein
MLTFENLPRKVMPTRSSASFRILISHQPSSTTVPQAVFFGGKYRQSSCTISLQTNPLHMRVNQEQTRTHAIDRFKSYELLFLDLGQSPVHHGEAGMSARTCCRCGGDRCTVGV